MCLRWNMENLCSECEHALNSLISVWATLQRFVEWHNLVWPIQYNIAIIIIMIVVVVVCYRLLSTCSMSFFPSDAKLDIYLHSKTQAGFFYIFYYIGCKRFRYFWIYILFLYFLFFIRRCTKRCRLQWRHHSWSSKLYITSQLEICWQFFASETNWKISLSLFRIRWFLSSFNFFCRLPPQINDIFLYFCFVCSL